MKKILLLLIGLLCITGCGNAQKSYITLNFEQLENKISEQENFILYISATGCTNCDVFKPTLEAVIRDYQVDVYQIDTRGLTKQQLVKLSNIIQYTGTPTVAFIEHGEEKSSYNRIEGAQNYDEVVKKFKQNGYIKGE